MGVRLLFSKPLRLSLLDKRSHCSGSSSCAPCVRLGLQAATVPSDGRSRHDKSHAFDPCWRAICTPLLGDAPVLAAHSGVCLSAVPRMVREGEDAKLVERRPYQKIQPLVSGWWHGSAMKVSAIIVMILPQQEIATLGDLEPHPSIVGLCGVVGPKKGWMDGVLLAFLPGPAL